MAKDKYTYVVIEDKKTVIAMCTFAGRKVKAKAICSPEDTFDVEVGKRLAKAKCEAKVATKRYNHAVQRYNCACDIMETAQKNYQEAKDYFIAACDLGEEATEELLKAFSEVGVKVNE